MEILKTLRGNLTQGEMAERLGLNRETYRNYENGSREPDIATLKHIAGVCGVSVDYLIGVESSKPKTKSGMGFIKVACASPDIRVADCEYNSANIVDTCITCAGKGVKLVVFPELSITGYTASDLFYQDVLLDGAMRGLEYICNSTKHLDMVIMVGMPFRYKGLLYNTAVCVSRGVVRGIVPKTYIPNYNEFYERRQFHPAEKCILDVEILGNTCPFGTDILFDIDGYKVCAEICEDLWVANAPSTRHATQGAEIIVNLSASDEVIGKAEYRRNLVSMQSGKLICAYLYADAGYGESTTDLVFAGHDLICENGSVLAESKLFSKDIVTADIDVQSLRYYRSHMANYDREILPYTTVDTEVSVGDYDIDRTYPKYPFVPSDSGELSDRASLIIEMQARGLLKRLEHTHAKTAVIGISGGLDSSLAVLVACKAMSLAGRPATDILAVTMPCYGTTGRTLNNSIELCSALGVSFRRVDIGDSVTQHLKDIGHDIGESYDIAYENAQARERTQVLMDLANLTGGMVIGTGDLSELALGWATYNGDHMSMYGVNCSIPKTLVRHLIKHEADKGSERLKAVLYDILDTPISPELIPAQNDEIVQKTEDIVGPYVLHDFFLYNMLRKGFSPKKLRYIATLTFKDEYDQATIDKWLKTFVKRFFAQQFKRSCLPDGVKVGTVTLSPRGDWRMPSDAVVKLWLEEIDG